MPILGDGPTLLHSRILELSHGLRWGVMSAWPEVKQMSDMKELAHEAAEGKRIVGPRMLSRKKK